MGRTRETSEARQRILETADRLFYQDGLRAVGIDRIIAEAEVAKMSLYKHFPSKDDLILAVLKYREQGVLEFFRSAMERHGKKAKNPLRAFFVALKEWFETPGFRGCASERRRRTRRSPHPAPSSWGGKRFSEPVGWSKRRLAAAVKVASCGSLSRGHAGIQGRRRRGRDAALKLVGEEKG
jgi:AcrR family transcriptional regulator